MRRALIGDFSKGHGREDAADGTPHVCDWVTDDMPYAMRTETRVIHSLPLSNDIDDYIQSWSRTGTPRMPAPSRSAISPTFIRNSETHGGRMLALSLHPSVINQHAIHASAGQQLLARQHPGFDRWIAGKRRQGPAPPDNANQPEEA
jgi:hypothetical protein